MPKLRGFHPEIRISGWKLIKETSIAIESLREFIDSLDQRGEIVHVKQEVDWDCAVGAIKQGGIRYVSL